MTASATRDLPAAPAGFAHRGGGGPSGENTLAAFRDALSAGIRALESDLWITADGVPVLDHDGVVPAHGGGQKPIAALKRDDLPPHIPALVDLWAHCGHDFDLSLDVSDARALQPALTLAKKIGATSRLWVVGSWPLVASWRALDDGVRIVAGIGWRQIPHGFSTRLDSAHQMGVDAINMPYYQWSPPLVRAVHERGLLAFGWHANNARQIGWLRRCGVNSVYSDSVTELLALQDR